MTLNERDENQTIDAGARALPPLVLDALKAEREVGKRYADVFAGAFDGGEAT